MAAAVRDRGSWWAARFENIRLKTGPRLHYAEYGNPDGEPVVFLLHR